MADTDELALKRQQLDQIKREIEENLETSRNKWSRVIREGNSSNQGYAAFTATYEAQCSRLRELFAEKWQIEREIKCF